MPLKLLNFALSAIFTALVLACSQDNSTNTESLEAEPAPETLTITHYQTGMNGIYDFNGYYADQPNSAKSVFYRFYQYTSQNGKSAHELYRQTNPVLPWYADFKAWREPSKRTDDLKIINTELQDSKYTPDSDGEQISRANADDKASLQLKKILFSSPDDIEAMKFSRADLKQMLTNFKNIHDFYFANVLPKEPKHYAEGQAYDEIDMMEAILTTPVDDSYFSCAPDSAPPYHIPLSSCALTDSNRQKAIELIKTDIPKITGNPLTETQIEGINKFSKKTLADILPSLALIYFYRLPLVVYGAALDQIKNTTPKTILDD